MSQTADGKADLEKDRTAHFVGGPWHKRIEREYASSRAALIRIRLAK